MHTTCALGITRCRLLSGRGPGRNRHPHQWHEAGSPFPAKPRCVSLKRHGFAPYGRRLVLAGHLLAGRHLAEPKGG